MCLVTLPIKTNVNAANNNTTLTENNTSQWKVVELGGGSMWSQVVNERGDYVIFRMMQDWNQSDYIWVYPQHVIWDFNGHTLTFTGVGSMANPSNNTEYFEFTDSSAAGNGALYNYTGSFSLGFEINPAQALIISGGTINCNMQTIINTNVVITGGNVNYRMWSGGSNRVIPANNTFYLGAGVTFDGQNYRSDRANTTYAVSTSNSDILSGLYNYEFSDTRYLPQASCLLAKVSGGQSYLWKNGQLLGLMDEYWYRLLK